jgi:hypothetical protein
MKDYEKTYKEFWKEIVERNGKLNMIQIKKELFDYHKMMGQVGLVYDHITGGAVSKPNTEAKTVIAIADDVVGEQIANRAETIRQMIELLDKEVAWCHENAESTKGFDRAVFIRGLEQAKFLVEKLRLAKAE